MSRRDRRYQKKAAKEFHSRKPVKADRKVLVILAVSAFVLVAGTYYLRYSGAI